MITGWLHLNRHVRRICFLLVILPWCLGLFVYLFTGFDISLVSQAIFDRPGPPLTRGRVYEEDFLFPTMPVTAVAVPFGTFARRNHGRLSGSITVDTHPELRRDFSIDLDGLADNQWRRIPVKPLSAPAGSHGKIRIAATDVSPGNEVTLWITGADRFRDGVLTVDGVPLAGDMAFRLTGRIRGLALVRMAGSRWRQARTGIFGQPWIPLLLTLVLLASLVMACRTIMAGGGSPHE